MAAGEMGCHSATIPYALLEELAQRPYDPAAQPGEGIPKKTDADHYKDAAPLKERFKHLLATDPLASNTWDGKLAGTDVDYLADGGKKLQDCILADPVAKQRLDDALELFIGGENSSKAKIEAALNLVQGD